MTAGAGVCRRGHALALAALAVGCTARHGGPVAAALHPGCPAGERAKAAGCAATPALGAAAVAANDPRVLEDPAAALAAADAVPAPLDRQAHARLWRQRGMAHALLAHAAAAEGRDDPSVAAAKAAEQAAHERAALDAFDLLLAIDATHRLEYTQSPQATFVFQAALAAAAARPAPALDLDWARDLRVGDAVPVDVEVIADPRDLLARAELYVRRRGDAAWQVATLDLPAPGRYRRLVLPGALGAGARGTTALELHLRAFDRDGNEVLTWASPQRPREVPLRWAPPTPWWRRWWVWAVGGAVVAGATGTVVYATQWTPSARLDADVTVR